MSGYFGGGGGGRGRSSSHTPFGGGGGGGGGRFSHARGGGSGGGRFSTPRGGSSNRGGGGRFYDSTHSHSQSQQNPQQQYDATGSAIHVNIPPPRLKPCSYYVSSGSCTNNPCNFAHVIKMHASIECSNILPSSAVSANNGTSHHSHHTHSKGGAAAGGGKRAPVSDIALYQDPNTSILQIFASSHDGNWRMYNTSNSFTKEVEHTMSSSSTSSSTTIDAKGQPQQALSSATHKVGTLTIASNFLFCGFEGINVQVPDVITGMIFAWNLNAPTDPPMEFHMSPPYISYAHSSCITSFITNGKDICISGSIDGTIRVWKFDPQYQKANVPSSSSSSSSIPSSSSVSSTTTTAGSFSATTSSMTPTSLVDSEHKKSMGGFTLVTTFCGHVGEITGLVILDNSNILWSSSTDRTLRIWDITTQQCQYLITKDIGGGHLDAVTCLIPFTSTLGNFIFSGSLDGTIKVWNSLTAECVGVTSHGVGVVSMALSDDVKGNPILLVGTTTGKIMVRNVLQTPTTPAFCLLCSLDARYTYCGHDGPVKCLKAGPSHTFYSGGSDGLLCVWEITGDFGI